MMLPLVNCMVSYMVSGTGLRFSPIGLSAYDITPQRQIHCWHYYYVITMSLCDFIFHFGIIFAHRYGKRNGLQSRFVPIVHGPHNKLVGECKLVSGQWSLLWVYGVVWVGVWLMDRIFSPSPALNVVTSIYSELMTFIIYNN